MQEEFNKTKKDKVIITVLVVAIMMMVAFLIYYLVVATEKRVETRVEETRVEEEVRRETGMSPVEEGRVVTGAGEDVRYDVEPGSPDGPQQSSALTEDQIPQDSVRITASRDEGYNPSEFTVSSGDVVNVSVTSVDERVYVFKFRDPSLSAIALGVGPGETRSITFNAPSRGEYDFYCDVPGCNVTGKMIVR